MELIIGLDDVLIILTLLMLVCVFIINKAIRKYKSWRGK